ncbi:hypothetical protein EDB84DRAFT_1265590 [Lactarius hengduanensis]|nr:hypothetical protein EDB84DRAFT_1265590 [Lactarius hengduanensis]
MSRVDVYSVLLETIEPGNCIVFILSHCRVTECTLANTLANTVSDEAVEQLGFPFSDQLLLAVLDLIDRDCGKCLFPSLNEMLRSTFRHGVHFSGLGMTDSYTVFPSLHCSYFVPHFCTCPAFAYAVLILHIPGCFQCKHILATIIAEHCQCAMREVGKDEFVVLLTRRNLDT